MATFGDLGLGPLIIKALDDLGFVEPTPIQSKAIPHVLNTENDLIALAQTGTGKTAAFSLPILQKLDPDQQTLQALVICPTRELALQIATDIEKFVKYLNLNVAAVYGGERVDKQISALKKKPQIVVGTPGRVNDLLRRRLLKPQDLAWLVLDEADEMLNMGFKEELDEILTYFPETKRTLLFSATMNQSVRRIAENYMNQPDDIEVGNRNQAAATVNHFYYVFHERDRYQVLRRILDAIPEIQAIIFCRTRRETQEVADKLIQDHYPAEAIHGEISQELRMQALNRFRNKKIQLLVATDVAARGIDINDLSYVINYNLPDTDEAYVHRSGRTGRANKQGVSLLLVNTREEKRVTQLERKISGNFEKSKIPHGQFICEKQLFYLIDKIKFTEVNDEKIKKYLPAVFDQLNDLSREELIKRMVSVEFNKFLEHYENSPDLNLISQAKARDLQERKSGINFARFKMSFGKRNGITVRGIFKFINSSKNLKKIDIGDINIGENETVIEAEESAEKQLIDYFASKPMDGQICKLELIKGGITSTRHKRFEKKPFNKSFKQSAEPFKKKNNFNRSGFEKSEKSGNRGFRKNSENNKKQSFGQGRKFFGNKNK